MTGLKGVHSEIHTLFPASTDDGFPTLNKPPVRKLIAKIKNISHKVVRQRSKRLSNETVLLYERRRTLAKQTAQLHRESTRARRGQEKEHKRQILGGTMWGYGPMAGRQHGDGDGDTDQSQGCYMFKGARRDSDDYGPEEVDALRRRTGKFWYQGTKWGIECGRPGQ